ncbi:HPP family protein [Bdellovibrio sp. HCB209]|uniref:CBS domain-containing protein n=1 Tax=Bdellovibrio sp. HCB209 TaxID=3394354 RepID=UPI0039B3BB62
MTSIARDVMTNTVIMIAAGESLAAAQNMMREKNIRHLPVVDDKNKIVGILSDRDFSHLPNPEQVKVDALMSWPVSWMSQETPLATAVKTMVDKKISSILITDEKSELVGIVTSEDLLKLLGKILETSASQKKSLSTLFDIESLDEIAYKISQTGI